MDYTPYLNSWKIISISFQFDVCHQNVLSYLLYNCYTFTDLYGTHFEVQTEEIFFPGVDTTFGFDAKIYNLESSAIREATTTDPDNFIIKVTRSIVCTKTLPLPTGS